MKILNIKNIIAFVFAWNPKDEDEKFTVYVSYAIRDPNGKYKKTILIKLGFIGYVTAKSICTMITYKSRYVFYPPIDLQPNQGIATIYLCDHDIPPSELGPERLNRTFDTCKELTCNLKSHIDEIEYIDWDCAYSLEEGDKELSGKYVCVVKDDGSERRTLITEWNSNQHEYLVPSELTKDASEQRDLFIDTSLHHTDEKVDDDTEINESEGSPDPIEIHDSFTQAAQWIIQNYSYINEHYGITISMTLERAAKAFLDIDRNKPDLVASVTDLLFQGCIFLKELARKNNRDEPELSNMVCAMATIKGGIFGNQTHFGHLYFVRPENDEIYGEADGYNKGHMCDTCEYKNERSKGKCKYDDFAKENSLLIKNCDNCILYRETMKFLDATKRLDVPNRLKYLLTNSNIAQITQ